MKVETPQILWNSEENKGINAALNSISMLESGLSEHADNDENGGRKYGTVMATAGNTNIINMWKVSFPTDAATASNTNTNTNTTTDMFQKHTISTKIDYLCGLTRQELAVNTVAFSPDGLHLATGGESGALVVWSVPPNKRGGGNGRHYWSTVEREQDLNMRIISGRGQGVCDIAWSADSKRFIAGTIDHSVYVYEDRNYDANQKNMCSGNGSSDTPILDPDWHLEYQNRDDHRQYVQGVAYDPLGVYLASMGSDRTVRVFPRKTPSKYKKKVLRPSNNGGAATDCCPPPDHQRMVEQILTHSKLEISKSKLIKYRRVEDSTGAGNDNNNAETSAAADGALAAKPQRHHLYADESTHKSLFRRLAWTTDGAFLVTPAALCHDTVEEANNADSSTKKSLPMFATYLFARHKFEEPCKVLSGLEQPSLVVRSSPVLYKLPTTSVEAPSPTQPDCKENESPLKSGSNGRGLPYRSVFAVLTADSILVYDTHHTRPLSVVRGLHYAGLTDCQWSDDGTKLVVSSRDGYISFISFENGELGEVYKPVGVATESSPLSMSSSNPFQNSNIKPNVLLDTPKIPPCEPGQSATLEAPPSKRSKKTRITPTLITPLEQSSSPATTTNNPSTPGQPLSEQPTNGTVATVTSNSKGSCHTKRSADEVLEHETNHVGEAVTKLTLNNDEKPNKKKKRIQPVLVSAGNTN